MLGTSAAALSCRIVRGDDRPGAGAREAQNLGAEMVEVDGFLEERGEAALGGTDVLLRPAGDGDGWRHPVVRDASGSFDELPATERQHRDIGHDYVGH